MAKAHSKEQWDKARALYCSGKTYKEVASETGIKEGLLRKKGSKDKWTEQKNKIGTKREQIIDEKIAKQAAANVAAVLEPLKQASTQLVTKALELLPQIDRASDVRAVAGAIKDLSQVIRELNGLLTVKEQAELQNARDRLALDRERLQQTEGNTDTEIKFVIEYEDN